MQAETEEHAEFNRGAQLGQRECLQGCMDACVHECARLFCGNPENWSESQTQTDMRNEEAGIYFLKWREAM